MTLNQFLENWTLKSYDKNGDDNKKIRYTRKTIAPVKEQEYGSDVILKNDALNILVDEYKLEARDFISGYPPSCSGYSQALYNIFNSLIRDDSAIENDPLGFKNQVKNIKNNCSGSPEVLKKILAFIDDAYEPLQARKIALIEQKKAEKFAKEEKEKADIAARKAREEEETRSLEAKRKAENARIEAEREAAATKENAEQEKHEEEIKSGKKPIQNIFDAAIFYDAKENIKGIAMMPPLAATEKKYITAWVSLDSSSSIKSVKGDTLVCEMLYDYVLLKHKELLRYYFALKFTNQTKGAKMSNLKINGPCAAVGTHVGNLEYTTVDGEKKIMPLFEAVHVFESVY